MALLRLRCRPEETAVIMKLTNESKARALSLGLSPEAADGDKVVGRSAPPFPLEVYVAASLQLENGSFVNMLKARQTKRVSIR